MVSEFLENFRKSYVNGYDTTMTKTDHIFSRLNVLKSTATNLSDYHLLLEIENLIKEKEKDK